MFTSMVVSHCCLSSVSLEFLFSWESVIIAAILMPFIFAFCVIRDVFSYSLLPVRFVMSMIVSASFRLSIIVLCGLVVIVAVWTFAIFAFFRWVIVLVPCSPIPMMRVLGFVCCVASTSLFEPCHLGWSALLVGFLPGIFLPPPNLYV